MTDLNFIIDNQNFLKRTDSNHIINQTEDEYICHFSFQNEEWDNIEKYVTFSIKGNTYTAILGTESECSSPIPYGALTSCIITVKVHGEDIISRNQVSLVVSQPKDISQKQCPAQDDYKDVYADTYNKMNTKFDDAKLIGNDLIFYANGQETSRLSLIEVMNIQSDWEETDNESPHYIHNKPTIINNFRYENDDLICLENNTVKQRVSLKHNHQSMDITDFDDEIDIDLNNLLISMTENIRSL